MIKARNTKVIWTPHIENYPNWQQLYFVNATLFLFDKLNDSSMTSYHPQGDITMP